MRRTLRAWPVGAHKTSSAPSWRSRLNTRTNTASAVESMKGTSARFRTTTCAFGVRICTAHSNGQSAYRLGFVEEPLAGDGVTEMDGTRVFVAPEAVEPLDGAVLDVAESGRLTLTKTIDR